MIIFSYSFWIVLSLPEGKTLRENNIHTSQFKNAFCDVYKCIRLPWLIVFLWNNDLSNYKYHSFNNSRIIYSCNLLHNLTPWRISFISCLILFSAWSKTKHRRRRLELATYLENDKVSPIGMTIKWHLGKKCVKYTFSKKCCLFALPPPRKKGGTFQV